MFDRHKGGEKAILVQVNFPEIGELKDLQEFTELALAAKATVLDSFIISRKAPDAKHFLGIGKVEEIKLKIQEVNADIVLINNELSPSQERNLEKFFNCRVVDRSGLILDIFAQRARTFEGRLQVELAQLEHLSTRLIRGWTHLERQKGGIGLRGPGEKQLETDRRLLKNRILFINKRLSKVKNSRQQNRQSRSKNGELTVSLVGYTNAGKSLLFNSLTNAEIYTDDMLFATLDPTMRKLNLSVGNSVILADTVGFISNLPHNLIKAFHATLEETTLSDLILHVIDISDEYWQEKANAVELVLSEIGVSKNIPIIQVYNKIDLINAKPKMSFNNKKVWVSAKDKLGLDYLVEAISNILFGKLVEKEIILNVTQSKLRATLYALKSVLNETPLENGGWKLNIQATPEVMDKILKD